MKITTKYLLQNEYSDIFPLNGETISLNSMSNLIKWYLILYFSIYFIIWTKYVFNNNIDTKFRLVVPNLKILLILDLIFISNNHILIVIHKTFIN